MVGTKLNVKSIANGIRESEARIKNV